MAKIGLVTCGSQKLKHPASAQDIYVSALFTKSRRWVEANCEQWYILSAKHGLLDPTLTIEPYNMTLNTMPSQDRWQWASGVVQAISQKIQLSDRLVILAGQKYREHLIQPLEFKGYQIEIPMAGLPIDKQLQWLEKDVK